MSLHFTWSVMQGHSALKKHWSSLMFIVEMCIGISQKVNECVQ